MNSEFENKIDDQLEKDEHTDQSSWSKVSANKNTVWYLDKRLWIIAGAIFVFILMMLLSPHKKEKTVSQDKAVAMQSDNSVLEQNLAKLSSMSTDIQKDQHDLAMKTALLNNQNSNANGLSNEFLSAPNQEKTQKQLMARQNAPTAMFSVGGATGGFSNSAVKQNASQNASASTGGTTFAGQGVYTSFGNQSMTSTAVVAKKIAHPDYTVASGEFLHAVLETAIDSDLPGEIRAVVSEPVYAYVGETPLIPAGSRLIGQYSSSVAQGQNRVFVIWNRVILPNGTSAQINSPGVDQLGIAGQAADDVNTHFLTRFGEASLLSIIGAGAANAGVNNADQYNSASQYRMAIAQSFQQSADSSLQNTLQTKPTLIIDQGAAINVFVAHDIDFYSVMKAN